MHGKLIKQSNNLKITYDKNSNTYCVYTPDGKTCLLTTSVLEEAVDYCANNKTYVVRKKQQSDIPTECSAYIERCVSLLDKGLLNINIINKADRDRLAKTFANDLTASMTPERLKLPERVTVSTWLSYYAESLQNLRGSYMPCTCCGTPMRMDVDDFIYVKLKLNAMTDVLICPSCWEKLAASADAPYNLLLRDFLGLLLVRRRSTLEDCVNFEIELVTRFNGSLVDDIGWERFNTELCALNFEQAIGISALTYAKNQTKASSNRGFMYSFEFNHLSVAVRKYLTRSIELTFSTGCGHSTFVSHVLDCSPLWLYPGDYGSLSFLTPTCARIEYFQREGTVYKRYAKNLSLLYDLFEESVTMTYNLMQQVEYDASVLEILSHFFADGVFQYGILLLYLFYGNGYPSKYERLGDIRRYPEDKVRNALLRLLEAYFFIYCVPTLSPLEVEVPQSETFCAVAPYEIDGFEFRGYIFRRLCIKGSSVYFRADSYAVEEAVKQASATLHAIYFNPSYSAFLFEDIKDCSAFFEGQYADLRTVARGTKVGRLCVDGKIEDVDFTVEDNGKNGWVLSENKGKNAAGLCFSADTVLFLNGTELVGLYDKWFDVRIDLKEE